MADRPRGRSDEEATPPSASQWDTESRGTRRRGRRIERSYENKAKPEGGVRYAHATIDTQDRRSNFRSCHSDASWRVPPRLLHAFTHTLAEERSAKPELPGALHIRRELHVTISLTHGCETRERWMLTRLLRRESTILLGESTRNRIVINRNHLHLSGRRTSDFASDCFRKRPRSFNFSQFGNFDHGGENLLLDSLGNSTLVRIPTIYSYSKLALHYVSIANYESHSS